MFGWLGAAILRGSFVHVREATEADREKVRGILTRVHEKAKYGLSMETEMNELIAFQESMIE